MASGVLHLDHLHRRLLCHVRLRCTFFLLFFLVFVHLPFSSVLLLLFFSGRQSTRGFLLTGPRAPVLHSTTHTADLSTPSEHLILGLLPKQFDLRRSVRADLLHCEHGS